ncbi:Wzz/FepE/Etk N-terminal domain-containing protein [Cetobacterium sp.]|uniref:Wzz/FepE/Etk N-terminal domain-containing protein n=1 Tax=Cetobacterium sp. TaxID=2071632 RepID=UPI003F3430B9
MKENLQIVPKKYEDDEIDLYELIEIMVRRKTTIVLTTILCTGLALGAALYVRGNKPDYLIKNIVLLQETFNLKGVNLIDVNSILLQDKNVKKLLENDSLRAEYLKRTSKESQNTNSERKFLKEVFNVSKDEKNPNVVTIKAELIGTDSSTRKVIEQYIDIIKSSDNIADVIANEKVIKTDELARAEKEIKAIQDEVLAIFKNDSDLRALKAEEKASFLNFKYPAVMLKKSEAEKNYNLYSNELIRLNNLNLRYDSVKSTSDIYLEEGKSKAKLILAVGAILGVFLGVMLAFLKEFVDGYKKRYK